MDIVVAGIARTSDPKELEGLLMGCAHLDASRLTVITKQQQTGVHDASPLRFLHSGGSAAMRAGSDGTGVPGMGSGTMTLSAFTGSSSVPHYLEQIAIHRDVAENYNIAIDEGRSVITYKATDEEAPVVQETFRGCGLVNVKTLKPRAKTTTGTA